MEKSPNETFNDYYKKIINKIPKYIHQQKHNTKPLISIYYNTHIHKKYRIYLMSVLWIYASIPIHEKKQLATTADLQTVLFLQQVNINCPGE